MPNQQQFDFDQRDLTVSEAQLLELELKRLMVLHTGELFPQSRAIDWVAAFAYAKLKQSGPVRSFHLEPNNTTLELTKWVLYHLGENIGSRGVHLNMQDRDVLEGGIIARVCMDTTDNHLSLIDVNGAALGGGFTSTFDGREARIISMKIYNLHRARTISRGVADFAPCERMLRHGARTFMVRYSCPDELEALLRYCAVTLHLRVETLRHSGELSRSCRGRELQAREVLLRPFERTESVSPAPRTTESNDYWQQLYTRAVGRTALEESRTVATTPPQRNSTENYREAREIVDSLEGMMISRETSDTMLISPVIGHHTVKISAFLEDPVGESIKMLDATSALIEKKRAELTSPLHPLVIKKLVNS